MNVLSGVKKKFDKDPEKEELHKQVRELKERVSQLEHDNDVLVAENLSLQEQLEEEKQRSYDLCLARVEEKKAQLGVLSEEEQVLDEQKELLKALGAEITKYSMEVKAPES
eukprot:TRINITY_DN5589_c0_g1_i2.p5 TRINITY_DN5589_c0_g1~~TRINITY_DN5589_c0_g1_i2.p5  ORF type:complete len:111 (+),score=42.31 TRINITY_DN5589_c0_g1_i2:62-394(+)